MAAWEGGVCYLCLGLALGGKEARADRGHCDGVGESEERIGVLAG